MGEEKPKRKKRQKISAADRRRRSEQMVEMNKQRGEDNKIAREAEELALKENMPAKDKMFADLYVWGDDETRGNHKACFLQVFGSEIKDLSAAGRRLLAKPHMTEYIDKQIAEFENLMKVEKIKNISTLTKIRDEMTSAKYVNRFGEINGVAACRSVAIRATETINKMAGFEKPTTVNLAGGEAGGVTFNLIVPEPPKPEQPIDITPHEEI